MKIKVKRVKQKTEKIPENEAPKPKRKYTRRKLASSPVVPKPASPVEPKPASPVVPKRKYTRKVTEVGPDGAPVEPKPKRKYTRKATEVGPDGAPVEPKPKRKYVRKTKKETSPEKNIEKNTYPIVAVPEVSKPPRRKNPPHVRPLPKTENPRWFNY